jgi:hypothetical protein
MKILLLFFCLLFITTSCRKEENSHVNIVLYDKPLETIQHYIHGKWKLAYAKGGICSTCMQECNNCFIEFTPDNKFISNTFAITTDTTTINWVREIRTYTNNGYTYLMTFKDKEGVPWAYVIERIYNDTLIYHDNSADAVFYHFIKLE